MNTSQLPAADIVFFGIQGSGKGTQAAYFVENYGYEYCATGSYLRKLVRENSHPEALRIGELLQAGHLVPDELIFEIFQDYLNADPEKRIVFDGFPRTMSQFQRFEDIYKRAGKTYVAVYFELSLTQALNRISHRIELVSGKEEKRNDDKDMNIIAARFTSFYTHTFPVVAELLKEERMIFVNAEQSPDAIHQDVLKEFAALEKSKQTVS